MILPSSLAASCWPALTHIEPPAPADCINACDLLIYDYTLCYALYHSLLHCASLIAHILCWQDQTILRYEILDTRETRYPNFIPITLTDIWISKKNPDLTSLLEVFNLIRCYWHSRTHHHGFNHSSFSSKVSKPLKFHQCLKQKIKTISREGA